MPTTPANNPRPKQRYHNRGAQKAKTVKRVSVKPQKPSARDVEENRRRQMYSTCGYRRIKSSAHSLGKIKPVNWLEKKKARRKMARISRRRNLRRSA